MSRLRTSFSTRVATVAATTLLAAALGACGTETSGGDTDGDRTAPDEATQGPTDKDPSPTDESTADDGDETPATEVPSDTPARDLASRLVASAELPGANEVTNWRTLSTGPEGGRTLGSCMRFSMVDIGADQAFVRTHGDGDVTAVQVLGQFADVKSAERAHAVLRTWVTKCAEHLDEQVEKVGQLRTVPVPGGSGESATVQYGDDGAEMHTFAGIALTQVGNRLSMIEIDVPSQDYNYPAGEEPETRAVTAAAGPLG